MAKIYLARQAHIAPVETSATASRAYAAGEYLMYNDTMYKVTAAIAQGGTITVGTNVEATDVATELQNGGGGGSLALDRIYIATAPTKTAYKAGQTFDPTGMVVKADYSIGGHVVVEGAVITGYTYPTGALTVDITSATISYSEGGVTKTASQAISVTKTSVTVPTYSSSLTYDGSEKTATFNNAPSSSIATISGNKGTNAGSYTARFTLTDTGLYVWADGSTAAYKDVAWSIAQASPTLTASPSSVTLDADHLTATSTITCNGDGTLSVSTSDSSIATATISNKVVTISHVNKTSGSATITVTHTARSGGNYSTKTTTITVEASFTQIYGATWDGSSTTKWTRTDAAASFTDPVPYVSGASSYGSPFDTISPWKDMTKVEDSAAGTLVQIPKFYYKLTQNGNAISVQISATEEDGFSVSPAHMDRGDGKGERDVVYIGRYHCGASAYKSASGQNPKNNTTRANFRSSIHNLGSTIWQADWAMRFTLFLLYIVEFADWNSQAKIGRGCGNNSGVQAMGYTDSMPYHTGTTQTSRDTYGLGTQYRNIEGLWDIVYDLVDGCYNSSSGLMIILNPSSFSDSSGGTSVGTPSSGYPSKFSVKNVSGTFPLFIPSEASGSDSTYSCDSWYFSAGYPCVCAGGGYSQVLDHGLFFFSYTGASSAGAGRGSRLMKLP